MPEADPPLAENCQRCGSAAIRIFRGGTSSPRACRGAKCVRTNSSILLTMKIKVDTIAIFGDKPFLKQTAKALKLLNSKCPVIYESVVNTHLGVIKQASRSRIKVTAKPPTFYVGRKTAYYSLKWYACAIVHDAYHSKQYADYKKKHRKVPVNIYFSPEAELDCIKKELRVAEKLKLPKRDIDFKKSLDGSYIYWKKKDW